MARFYVIKGRRILFFSLLLGLIVVTLWYVLQPEPVENSSGLRIGVWSQFAPESLEDNQEQPAVEVITSGQSAELEEEAQVVTVRPVPTKFSEYRLERERARSKEIDLLESVIANSSTDAERRGEAQQELLTIMNRITRETEIENLLKAKGYLDAVVILETDSVTVVVPVTLGREEVQSIGDVVHRITGVTLEQITIVDEPSVQ